MPTKQLSRKSDRWKKPTELRKFNYATGRTIIRNQPCECNTHKQKRRLENLFELVASYADGGHYVETSDDVWYVMQFIKGHIINKDCDYVRVMRQRKYPPI